MEIPNEFIILMKFGPLKCMFELHFQIWTLPDIKLIFGHSFWSFCHDHHFEGSEDLSQFIHKIKFAKQHSHSEKTYFKYAWDVSFFVQYIYGQKGTDQLCGHCDQNLRSQLTDNTNILLLESKISSFQPYGH